MDIQLKRGLLDVCVLAAIKDTVDVLYFVKPVINMKSRSEELATDEEQD